MLTFALSDANKHAICCTVLMDLWSVWIEHWAKCMWLGGTVVRALDLRLQVAGSVPATALSSATLDKLFTHIVSK